MEKDLKDFCLRRKAAIERIMAIIKNNGNSEKRLSEIMRADDVENSENIMNENIVKAGMESIKMMLEERNKTVAICYHMDGICPICGKNNISVDLIKVLNAPVCGKTCLDGKVNWEQRLDKIIKEKGIKYVPLDFHK
jgi:hypothetical protein